MIAGAQDILTTCQFTSTSPLLNAVAALAPTLHDLLETAETITAKHDVVQFETNVSDDDLAALAHFVTVAQGQTKFIALVDDGLPLTKVRALGASGADDILPLDIKAGALIQAFADLARQPDALDPQGGPTGATARVFSIAQSRGGAGATTIAVNLATSLAAGAKRGQLKLRVLLLDLDLQFGNAGTYLDVENNGGLYDLLGQDSLPSEKAILGAVQTSGYGVDVLTAPTVFVRLNAMSLEFVAHMIGACRYAYDYLIIDLPRATMDWLAPVVMATDRWIMVSDSSAPCIRQAKRLIDLYRENRLTCRSNWSETRKRRLSSVPKRYGKPRRCWACKSRRGCRTIPAASGVRSIWSSPPPRCGPRAARPIVRWPKDFRLLLFLHPMTSSERATDVH
jgi:pilus assembly protein CpaE